MVTFMTSDAMDAQDTDSVRWVYDAVFGVFSDKDTRRAAVWAKHTARRGFRPAKAYQGEALVGFAYGYTGDSGSERGAGVGRQLMRTLLDGLPHERSVLMPSSDASDPARRLYASEGWHVLGPGIREGTVIMGRRLVEDLPTG